MTGSSAREILRRQGMPPEEVRVVLAGGDVLLARRLLELHRERLDEWLEEQRGLLTWIEHAVSGRYERREHLVLAQRMSERLAEA